MDPEFKDTYREEIKLLEEELKNKVFKDVDQRWEEFWATGKNERELVHACKQLGLKTFPERLTLLGERFRQTKGYKVKTELEMFQTMFIKDNKFFLV